MGVLGSPERLEIGLEPAAPVIFVANGTAGWIFSRPFEVVTAFLEPPGCPACAPALALESSLDRALEDLAAVWDAGDGNDAPAELDHGFDPLIRGLDRGLEPLVRGFNGRLEPLARGLERGLEPSRSTDPFAGLETTSQEDA